MANFLLKHLRHSQYRRQNPQTRLHRRIQLGFIGRAAMVLLGLALLAGVLFLRQAGTGGNLPLAVVSDRPLLATNGSAFDSAPVEAAAPAPAGQPRAALSADFHNFGAIGTQAVVRQDFLLSNSGSAPLLVRRAYTTCGCTSGEISASVIPPGKAARVTVIFDAGYHPAAGQTVRRGLILETNDPERPQVEIWVQAAVR